MTKSTDSSDQPPYLRIVAGIRQRILDGELGPGDVVPSTRQIARDWGVAIATATKALTNLRLQGIVETRPRSGTVVAATAAAASAGRYVSPAPVSEQELNLGRIVTAAIDIADSEGLTAVSMRGVAARLGVAAMSPYRYVPSKDDLVLLMADAAFGEVAYPTELPEEWRERVETGARTLWTLYRKHPWLAELGSLTRPLLVPNLMIYGECVLGALDGHGLDPVTQFDIHLLIYSHIQGLAVHLEWEAQAEATTGQSEDQWRDSRAPVLQRLVDSGRIPTYSKVMGGMGGAYDLRLDALFDLGLKSLLDGLTPLVEGRS